MENKEIWDALKQPPPHALKQIKGGRLSGMTDIKPQWRYEAITEQFGPCGIGWKFEVVKYWLEPASDDQVAAFVEILFYYNTDGEWCDPIPGTGGSMFIAKEKSGLHTSDEAYKMAVTDALSTALKMIGVGADVYAGLWTGKYYLKTEASPTPKTETPDKPVKQFTTTTDTGFPAKDETACTKQQAADLYKIGEGTDLTNREVEALCNWYKKAERLSYVEANEMIADFGGVVERYIDYINEIKK